MRQLEDTYRASVELTGIVYALCECAGTLSDEKLRARLERLADELGEIVDRLDEMAEIALVVHGEDERAEGRLH